jgi:hypothetical protein
LNSFYGRNRVRHKSYLFWRIIIFGFFEMFATNDSLAQNFEILFGKHFWNFIVFAELNPLFTTKKKINQNFLIFHLFLYQFSNLLSLIGNEWNFRSELDILLFPHSLSEQFLLIWNFISLFYKYLNWISFASNLYQFKILINELIGLDS